MKRTSEMTCVLAGVIIMMVAGLLSGCENIRFAPDQNQKKNAWLHQQTCEYAADAAREQNVPGELQKLTELSDIQSRAFTAYFGMPDELPRIQSIEDLIGEENFELAYAAAESASQRPDGWQVAEAAMNLGIAISAIVGGVYGTKVACYIKQAKQKAKALKEIIEGNELFKSNNVETADAFKQAHSAQSPETQVLVKQIKNQTNA
jgi:hypothetical protein